MLISGDLQDKWQDDCLAADLRAVPQHWEELLALYSGRPYHNILHAGAVRDRVCDLGGRPATKLAAWYHDVIYDPAGKDNEKLSGELARTRIEEAGGSELLQDEVSRLILITAHHRPAHRDAQGQILSDADLAILQADSDDYARYVSAIRQEYAFLDGGTFYQGRADFIQTLLERPHFYFTPQMVELEPRALANLRTELGWLQIRLGNP